MRVPRFGKAREPVRLTLYGRPDCHLCDVADAALRRASRRIPVEVVHVDISGDAALEERYGLRIPVVTDETGAVVCEGKVSETRIRASLRTRAQGR